MFSEIISAVILAVFLLCAIPEAKLKLDFNYTIDGVPHKLCVGSGCIEKK